MDDPATSVLTLLMDLPPLPGRSKHRHMMKLANFILLLFTVLISNAVAGTPREDLASPSQEIRDAAAARLRQNYVPVPESHWTAFIAKIKEAKNKTEVLALLKPLGITTGLMVGGGQAYNQSYQLDDEWQLICSFKDSDDSLFAVSLKPSMQRIMPIAARDASKPDKLPTKCTLYFANGQKSCDIEYVNGAIGRYVSYYPTGQKCVEQNYLPDGTTGEETGYYRSGKISYTTRYAADKQSKITTWYDEQGVMTNTRTSK